MFGYRFHREAAGMLTSRKVDEILIDTIDVQPAKATGVLVAFVSTVGILLSVYLSSQSKANNGRSPLPPGSLGLSWVVEAFDFLKYLTRNELVSFFGSKRAKFGETFSFNMMGTPVVILDPPAGLKFLFGNEGNLVETSWPKHIKNLLGRDSMCVNDVERYKIARRHSTNFLNPLIVAKQLPLVEQTTLDHFKTYWEHSAGGSKDDEVELSVFELMRRHTLGMVAGLCLSLGPGQEFEWLLKNMDFWVKGLFTVPINFPGSQYHSALKARGNILELLEKLMTRRTVELGEGRATDTQDVLSYLLTHPDQKGRKNTDEEIKDNILLFQFAGRDTTSAALTMALMYIAKHPTVYERLRKEHDAIASSKGQEEGYKLTTEDVKAMEYTSAVLKETLRLQPPGAGSFREAVQDFEYNGFTIPKGWKIYWTNQTSHENPKFFDNPKRFDPSRWEEGGSASNLAAFTFLPFGGGQRLCPGQEFAKMEVLVFLHYVVRNYTWTLSEPEAPVLRFAVPEQANGTLIKIRKLQRT